MSLTSSRRPTRLGALALGAVALLAVAASCTEKVTPPSAPPSPPPGSGPPMRPVVPDSVQAIFTASCALTNCHIAPTASGGELLDADSSYARTVNVFSVQSPAFVRILPGNANDSYLVMKIRGDMRISGNQMPLVGGPLPDSLRNRIANWVDQGALPDSIPADSSRLSPRPPTASAAERPDAGAS